MKFDKLYKKYQNGSIAYVDIKTRKVNKKDQYTITITKGKLGTSSTSVTKKVVKSSRKKTRSVLEETSLKVNQLLTEIKREGYKSDLEKVKGNDYNTFVDGSIMPMLLNKTKLSSLKYPCFAQRKYDGVRCIAEFKDNGIKLKSRKNLPYSIDHIQKSLGLLYKRQLSCPFDGELYCHNKPLGDIGSMVTAGDQNAELTYVIYDLPVEGLSFTLRRNLLYSLDLSNAPNIQIDYGVEINNEKELLEFNRIAIAEGYEGTVVCDPNGMYDFSYRTNSKTKIKPRDTDEFLCIDHYWNKGKMKKQSTLICQTKDGKNTFHVKMKGTKQQRENYAAEFDAKFKNKMVTVEYRKITKTGRPIEAVGIAVRDYE